MPSFQGLKTVTLTPLPLSAGLSVGELARQTGLSKADCRQVALEERLRSMAFYTHWFKLKALGVFLVLSTMMFASVVLMREGFVPLLVNLSLAAGIGALAYFRGKRGEESSALAAAVLRARAETLSPAALEALKATPALSKCDQTRAFLDSFKHAPVSAAE